jgi:Ni,Fe-hydrogenase III small subunit
MVRTLAAMPRPRLVVAVGACAISGGIFGTSYASLGGADRIIAVDSYAAGCPPRPWAMLRAIRLVLE